MTIQCSGVASEGNRIKHTLLQCHSSKHILGQQGTTLEPMLHVHWLLCAESKLLPEVMYYLCN